MFGNVRTITHGSNCDYLELIERLQLAGNTESIYQKHPEWRKKSRICASTNDYSSVNSWTGELNTKDLNEECIHSIWENGYHEAVDYLISNGFTRQELHISDTNVNILNPLGSSNRKSVNREEEEEEEDVEETVLFNRSEESNLEFIVADNLNNNNSKFTNTVEHDGLVFHKSNVISNIIHSQTKLSSKRTTRVYGIDETNFNVNGINEFSLEDDFIFITDILATILKNKVDNKLFICIFSIDKIQMESEIKDKVLISLVNDCKFTGSILHFESLDDNCLIWNGKFSEQVKELPGDLCCLFKADVDYLKCKVKISELNVIKEYFKKKIYETNNNKLKVDSVKLNVEEEIYDVLKLNDSTKNSGDEKHFICKLSNCNKLVDKERIIQHTGQHILNGNIIKNANVCGFCGQIGCKIDLVTTSGYGTYKTIGPHSNCLYFYPFKLGPAAKSTKRSPCTNRPIKCEVCNQVYWSYNILFHYQAIHPNKDLN